MRTLLLATAALVTLALPQVTACSNNDCTVTKTCPVGSSGQGGDATSSQGGGTTSQGGNATSSQGGSGGGPAITCQDGTVDVGEVCFAGAPVTYPTTKEVAAGLLIADCDGDGDLDAITADRDSLTITALRNNGTGVFTDANSTMMAAVTNPIDIADRSAPGGPLTIAVSMNGPGFTDTYQASGGCGFTLQHWFSHQSATNAITSVAAADLDGQGLRDVFVTIEDGTAIGYNDTGTGGPGVEYTNFNNYAIGAAAIDVDNDGDEDFIYADRGSDNLKYGRNNGDGTINSFNSGPIATGGGPAAIAVADMDGDGYEDIIVGQVTDNTIAVFRNAGTANLVDFSKLIVDVSITGTNGVPAADPASIAVGDVDGDGDVDVVTANRDASSGMSSITLLLNDGDAFLSVADGFPLAVERRPYEIALADLNADGALDIVTSHEVVNQGTSVVSVLLAQP